MDQLKIFEDSFLNQFYFSNEENPLENGDDISLKFDGEASNRRLVLSHTFTIPFQIRKDGLRRLNNWLKPLEHWRGKFIRRQLTRLDMESYQNQIYLEFDGEFVLLSNKKLIWLYNNQNKCIWSSIDGKYKHEK